MSYSRIEELPDPVLNDLPERAQELYKEAYNSAETKYEDPEKRREDESQVDAAHREAWLAVKEKYEKQDGRWVPQKQ